MLKELDNYDWKNAFIVSKIEAVINSRGIPIDGISRESVSRIISMTDGYRDGDRWTGIFELKDGRFISVCSWCDNTGWDCRGGGEMFVAKDEHSIKRFGLSEEERKRLGINIVENT